MADYNSTQTQSSDPIHTISEKETVHWVDSVSADTVLNQETKHVSVTVEESYSSTAITPDSTTSVFAYGGSEDSRILSETNTSFAVFSSDPIFSVTNDESVFVLTETYFGRDGINEEDILYSKRVDMTNVSNNDVIYRGEAVVGSLETSPVWRIRRITIAPDGDVREEWANGNSGFINNWVDRLTLNYI